jgi:outer membrane protein
MRFVHLALSFTVLAGLPEHASAQAPRPLSLEDALRLSQTQSEALRIAQAGVLRARGQQMQAQSQYLPQLSGQLGYTRTLATQFSVFQESAPQPGPGVPPVPPRDTTTFFQPCSRYLAPAGASDVERIRGLELFSRCSSGGGFDFSRAGFGARNQYQIAANGSLTLWSAGRVQSQVRAAAAGRRSADIEVASQRAQLALEVTEAYYDAVLAERLVAIAESSLATTEGTLRQTTLARQVGNQSEFDLLRARVTRDNQVPVVLQRRTDRELAHLRLKQLLNLPYAEQLQLTSDIDDGAGAGTAAVRLAANATPGLPTEADTAVAARAPVRQLDEAVKAQEAQLTIARRDWLPTIAVTSAYSRVAFGAGGVPAWGNWLNNWTVGVGASFPLFTGGRLRGAEMVARASVEESKARLDQTRELAALDAAQTLAQLQQAEAALAASAGTDEQATRAFAIANVRFREGLSTQIELSESRLNLDQARINRVLAARNLQVARMRLALLKDLPLGAGGALGGLSAGAGAGGNPMGGGTGAPGAAGGSASPGTRVTTQQASTSQVPQ